MLVNLRRNGTMKKSVFYSPSEYLPIFLYLPISRKLYAALKPKNSFTGKRF